MFQEDYKACNDSIKTDETLKEKVLAAPERVLPGKISAFVRIGVPALAALMIAVLAVGILLQPSNSVQGFKRYSSYGELYRDLTRNQQKELLISKKTSDLVDLAADGTNYVVAESNAASKDSQTESDYTGTNLQVEGIDEADVVKTDGRYIYVLSGDSFYVIKPDGAETAVLSRTNLKDSFYEAYERQLYVYGSRAAIVFYNYNTQLTTVCIYEITDSGETNFIKRLEQTGWYEDSRMIDGVLYVISDRYISLDEEEQKQEDYSAYVPQRTKDGELTYFDPGDIWCCVACPPEYGYTSKQITACDITDDGEFLSAQSIMGNAAVVYMNRESLYLAWYSESSDDSDSTAVVRFSIENGRIRQTAAAVVPGTVINQFAMDERSGVFRIATTVTTFEKEQTGYFKFWSYSSTQSSGVYLYDRNLNLLGELSGLAPEERIYSVRFTEDRAYIVTFRQTDPLFEIDISDPAHPALLDELKVNGVSDYLHSFGENRLLGIGRSGTEDGLDGNLKLTMFRVNGEGENEAITEYVIRDAWWSDIQYNHKVLLVDVERGLIAFPVYNNSGVLHYNVFTYSEEGGFDRVLDIGFENESAIRGVRIGSMIYIPAIDSGRLDVFDMDSEDLIARIRLT